MSERRTTAETSPSEVLAALRELIEALDRRVPQLARSGEVRIGKEAAMLRNEAVARIEALQQLGVRET